MKAGASIVELLQAGVITTDEARMACAQETTVRVTCDDPDVPWELVEIGYRGGLSNPNEFAAFLSPYRDVRTNAVRAWVYALAARLWFDLDDTAGCTREVVRYALRWASIQPDPVAAAKALMTIHVLHAERGESLRGQTAANRFAAEREATSVAEYLRTQAIWDRVGDDP